jgi:hypothetical protein
MNFPGFRVALQPGADQPEAEAIIASLPGMTWHCVNELTRQHTRPEKVQTLDYRFAGMTKMSQSRAKKLPRRTLFAIDATVATETLDPRLWTQNPFGLKVPPS